MYFFKGEIVSFLDVLLHHVTLGKYPEFTCERITSALKRRGIHVIDGLLLERLRITAGGFA